jgi:hypothetical protein
LFRSFFRIKEKESLGADVKRGQREGKGGQIELRNSRDNEKEMGRPIGRGQIPRVE